MRIGLADKTLVVAIAHAIVLRDIGDKKVPPETLAKKLEEGSETVKSIYR